MTSNIERVVRQLIEEGFNKGNMDIVNALTSPELVEHQNYGPSHPAGAEGVRAVVASLRRGFPDGSAPMSFAGTQVICSKKFAYTR